MEQEEWSTDSTKATWIALVQPGTKAPKTVSKFQPAFTHSVFGMEESIFGYKDLEINLSFATHDLRPNISWKFDDKFKSVGETEALDLKETLADFLPESAFEPQEEYHRQLQEEDSSGWKPPGEKVRSWRRDGREYEIWAGRLTDPEMRALVDRMQILIPLFIDGGTEIQLEDDDWTMMRWRVFLLYEKLAKAPTPTSSVYSFVGYSTTYRFTTYVEDMWALDEKTRDYIFSSTDNIDVLELPYRGRISQFIILEPHAHQGHGSMLYATIFKQFHDDPRCIEVTVEDPNEAFDDLRDYCDFTGLSQMGKLDKIRMEHNVDPKLFQHLGGRKVPTDALIDRELLASIRKESKIAKRQFRRLVEMWLLSKIPGSARQSGIARLTRRANTKDEGDRAFYFWRLLVKQRLYNQNKDSLKELEQTDVVHHLESTVDNLVAHYGLLLNSIAEKALKAEANPIEDGLEAAPSRKRGKRNLVVDDDDEDDENDGDRAKRQKSILDA